MVIKKRQKNAYNEALQKVYRYLFHLGHRYNFHDKISPNI